jgi:hypothetical protein
VSVHAYPPAVALADFARAGAGLLLCAIPLALADTIPAVTAVLAILSAVFALYALRVANRQMTRLEADDDGARARGPRTRAVRWRHLRRVRLAYYSTRRDRTGGWLQLTIAGQTETLRIDSRIADFHSLARRAAVAARHNGLKLDPTTLYNFHSLGLAMDEVNGREAAEYRR